MGFKKGARGGRLRKKMDPLAEAMNDSTGFDHRLANSDITGSIAHVRMLAASGIVGVEEAVAIEEGLTKVRQLHARGQLSLDSSLEDIHMNVEAALIREVGAVGMKLHTARSRNDQVATDLRLFTIDAARGAIHRLRDVRKALVDKAARHTGDWMPGYTHLQRAQPVSIAHHLLAYEAMFARDEKRLQHVIALASESPLGAGALAATPFPIDRKMTAKTLGFLEVTRNSMDAVSDRDFAIDLVNGLAICALHLSRLGEEIVLWMSEEFGFARVGDAYCSTSSIMPQKANPDIAELLRAKVGRVMGDWVTLATIVKGLPLAYNKDFQETQEPLYDAVDTVHESLTVAASMIKTLKFDTARCQAAIDNSYILATELADYLASKGVPFREAHHAVGALVAYAVSEDKRLQKLRIGEMRQFHHAFNSDVFEWLTAAESVARRDVIGGPAQSQVRRVIRQVRKELQSVQ